MRTLGRVVRDLAFVLLGGMVWVGGLSGTAAAQLIDYDIVYVRQPRYGDTVNTTWPEVSHPGRIDPGADLMLLHPDGSEEVLVDSGGVSSATDPFVSFDGGWVYYSLFYDPADINTQRSLSRRGADIFRINLATRVVEQLTFGEFTPNTGAGNFDESNPLNPGSGYDYLGYGILNLGPSPVAGGKIAFSSNRNGFMPPRGHSRPTMQLFVMDEDGGNVTAIAPMNIASALHPTPLQDGRLMFSTMETQGNRDFRLWGIWSIYPDGRSWAPVVSAFRSPQAFHFMTQLGNSDIVVVDYYNLNNNGFGALYRLPVQPPAGEPPFHSGFPSENPAIDQTVGGGFSYPFRMPFTPRGMYSITPFTHGNDNAAPEGANGVRVGKFTHPSAAPYNDLLVVWTPGPANDLNRPTTDPRYDAGLYMIANGDIVNGPDELILIKNDPNYNEAWPRAVVPYSAVHTMTQPVEMPWLPNDGTVHSELPAGTPYGLVGTSSFYKRESFPGSVRSWANTFDGLDAFNTTENGQSSNWGSQGSDAGIYDDSEIWAVRIVGMEPNTHRSYGPNNGPSGGNLYFNHANERLRILGEIPLRKFNGDGSPVLDPEGNPDTSFLAKIPADTPFTFQTIDRDGLVLNIAQTWHQVRPGEMRADCGGCHAHSQQPLAFEDTAAAQPDYQVADLVFDTPLLSKDVNGDPDVRVEEGGLMTVEFLRDIRPILVRSCVPCHTQSDPDPPGNLVLDDYDNYGNFPGDYARLAADSGAQWGHAPLVTVGSNPVWRQTNASRYVRRFQSRRSLLMWKILGRRTDGWTNQDHPSESIPGDPSSFPAGASINESDLDFTGSVMPPPGSGVPPLSDDEKMTVARWIDLGAPINWGGGGSTPWGWFLDEIRPTLTMSTPRPGENTQPVGEIRIGVADAHTGLDINTLSVSADFQVAGRAAGSELADLAVGAGDGIYAIALDAPITSLAGTHVRAEIADFQGNITRVDRSFSVNTTGAPSPTPTSLPSGTNTPTSTSTPQPIASDTPTSPPSPSPIATNTPTPTLTTTATETETATADPATPTPANSGISGSIVYNGSTQPLSGVAVHVVGSPPTIAVTDSSGHYDVAAAPGTTWTVRPSFDAPSDSAITAFDAAWALQSAVGNRQLTAIQEFACDVTGNGSVSSFDAARILQLAVGKRSTFTASEMCETRWSFFPTEDAGTPPSIENDECSHGEVGIADLPGGGTDVSFEAAVFGDCTSSWSAPLAAQSGLAAQPTVLLGNPVRSRGRYLRIPVRVSDVAEFSSLDMRIAYDPQRLKLRRVRRARAAKRALVDGGEVAPGSARAVFAISRPVQPAAEPIMLLIFERLSRRDRTMPTVLNAAVDDQPATIEHPAGVVRAR